jgi:drug/metabolite transporter (DMT)-like permease
MMHSNALAVVFALLSALTIAWGTVLRHQIAEQTSGDPDDAHGSPLLAAVMRPKWWGGVLCALAGYGLQIVALGFGTLLVVQPILVLSLMFTLPLSAKFDGRRVSKSEMFWAGLLTVAVGVLVIWGKPLPGRSIPELDDWFIALGAGLVVIVAMCWLAGHRPANQRALLLGLVTGIIMGYLAVLSKAVVAIFTADGIHGLITSWEGYGLLACAAIGTGVQQLSFNAGALKNSLPAMTIGEPIVAFILGYTLLAEKFQVHGLGWIAMAAALWVMVASTVVLSRKSVD